MSKILTADEFEEIHFGKFGTYSEMMVEFAKYHVTLALKKQSEMIELIESTIEKVNDQNIHPFITADDNTIWIVDKEKYINSYSLENIK